MPAKTRRPPILQQSRWEAITISGRTEIAIVYEDFKSIQGTSGHIINYIGVQLFKAPLRILSEQLLGSRLCKNFHRYGIVFIFKRFFQACLISLLIQQFC